MQSGGGNSVIQGCGAEGAIGWSYEASSAMQNENVRMFDKMTLRNFASTLSV